MKIQYYRIFIERTKQLSLLDDTTLTKKQLIDEAFNLRTGPHYFNMGSRKYAFVVHKEAGNYIYASLAKYSHVNVEHSPEENFQIEAVESWPNVPIIINTSDDPEIGQSIAIELDKAIFRSPIVQLKKLVEELAHRSIRIKGYEIALHPITEIQDFWDVIKNYKGNIHALTFEFSAPNLFKTNDSLNDELRNAEDTFGMTNASIKLENSEGALNVPEDNKFVEQGLKYITDGGGEYRIQVKNKRTITSSESIRSTVIDETEFEIATKNKDTLIDFCDRLFLWLKH